MTHVYVDSMKSSVYLTLGDLTVKSSISMVAFRRPYARGAPLEDDDE